MRGNQAVLREIRRRHRRRGAARRPWLRRAAAGLLERRRKHAGPDPRRVGPGDPLPHAGGRAAALRTDAGAPAFSPDGRFIAYASPGSGTRVVFVRSARGGASGRFRPSPAATREWSGDGRELFYIGIGSPQRPLMAVSVEGGPGFRDGPASGIVAGPEPLHDVDGAAAGLGRRPGRPPFRLHRGRAREGRGHPHRRGPPLGAAPRGGSSRASTLRAHRFSKARSWHPLEWTRPSLQREAGKKKFAR